MPYIAVIMAQNKLWYKWIFSKFLTLSWLCRSRLDSSTYEQTKFLVSPVIVTQPTSHLSSVVYFLHQRVRRWWDYSLVQASLCGFQSRQLFLPFCVGTAAISSCSVLSSSSCRLAFIADDDIMLSSKICWWKRAQRTNGALTRLCLSSETTRASFENILYHSSCKRQRKSTRKNLVVRARH